MNGSQESGRAIFITGAASGIGRETALLFARRGWRVGATDMNEAGLDALATEVGGERWRTARLDVPDLATYSATKFFIRGLTEALNLELERHGIVVSDLMPLYVDTPMVRDQAYRAGSLETFGARLKPEEIAEIVWQAVHGHKVHWV